MSYLPCEEGTRLSAGSLSEVGKGLREPELEREGARPERQSAARTRGPCGGTCHPAASPSSFLWLRRGSGAGSCPEAPWPYVLEGGEAAPCRVAPSGTPKFPRLTLPLSKCWDSLPVSLSGSPPTLKGQCSPFLPSSPLPASCWAGRGSDRPQ
ncbi:unnamed protein product, partial [Gulo gulo]